MVETDLGVNGKKGWTMGQKPRGYSEVDGDMYAGCVNDAVFEAMGKRKHLRYRVFILRFGIRRHHPAEGMPFRHN